MSEGGEERAWEGTDPGDEAGIWPGGHTRPYGDGVLGGVGDKLTGEGCPVEWSDMPPLPQLDWPYGTLGGTGASFLEAGKGRRRHQRMTSKKKESPPSLPSELQEV